MTPDTDLDAYRANLIGSFYDKVETCHSCGAQETTRNLTLPPAEGKTYEGWEWRWVDLGTARRRDVRPQCAACTQTLSHRIQESQR